MSKDATIDHVKLWPLAITVPINIIAVCIVVPIFLMVGLALNFSDKIRGIEPPQEDPQYLD